MAASAHLRRLKRRSQFLAARDGRTERRKSLVVQAVRRPAPVGDWIGEGYTATKKIGHSPARSRAKRRLREAARLLLTEHGVPGADYVFIARGVTGRIDWPRLLDDMKSALISLAPALDASRDPS
ncbi:MAG: ribonuclease P protein component [Hyphomonadaceae bacterium]|nr:ribonuclease P protein component [Hyphomonadaceae bacterium]